MRIYFFLLLLSLFHQQLQAQKPSISSFSPASGPIGTTIIINGTNFNTTPLNNKVFFGAVRAIVTAASTTSLEVTVPSGATYQPITVTTNGLTTSSFKPFVVTFTGGGTSLAASSFAPKTDLVTGKGPSCVISIDADLDGKPDLVVVNDTANTISIFRNISTSGNINLSASTDFATGNQPYCVVAGDLDGDGKPDIAVANGTSNTISVFRNLSTGPGIVSFSPKLDLQTGSFPFSVVITDLDGDGKPDLASTNGNNNSISVFKNSSTPGTLSFLTKADFATGTSPFWLAAGDIDGDGKPDIATANSAIDNSISVLRNTSISGNISFATKIDLNGGGYSNSIVMADMDGNGKLDLAVSGEGNATVAVILNSNSVPGNIIFGQASYYNSASASFGITVGDMDGDSKPDMMVTNTLSNTISVFRNNSGVGFPNFDQRKEFTVGLNPWVTVAVDLDGDGKPDIASANQRTANISVLKNTVSDIAIQNFVPASAGQGAKVTINGNNLAAVNSVSFGGVPASTFNIISSTSIEAILASGASGNVTVTSAGGSATLTGFTFLPPPTITSFTPTTAGSGDTVAIFGTNFKNVSSVKFGGTEVLSFNIISATEIRAVTGEGSSGIISITATDGIASLATFVYDNTPVISSISASQAGTGDTVLIIGKHLLGATAVSFGNIAAGSFNIVSPYRIDAIVGAGASGNVTVINTAGSAGIAGFTYFPMPVISNFNPVTAGRLQTVTITGSNFNTASAVSFGGIPAASFVVNSNTSISAILGGGNSGNLKVTTIGGTVSAAGFTFIPSPIPVVNSFSPQFGAIGSTVIISGQNFSSNIIENVVYFGAVKATILHATSNTLTVKVPTGATFQALSVTVNELTAYSSKFFGVIFNTGTDSFYLNSFAPKSDFAAGNLPTEVCISDFDNDGKADLAVANYSGQTISVLRNIGSKGIISFAQKADHIVPGKPAGMYVADIDGDGRRDIAVTCEFNVVSIFRNTSTNGNISFAPRLDVPASYVPSSITIGDLNRDGKPDLVVTNLHNNSISVYKNIGAVGTIIFDSNIDFITEQSPYYISINDFDDDGKADIAVANYYSTSISVLKNQSINGSISFDNKIDFTVGALPYKISLGDIDNDGKIDMATANAQSSTISILRNTSQGGVISFAPQVELTAGYSPYGVGMIDLDGDKLPDLASGNMSNNTISILRNVGSGAIINFLPKVDIDCGNAPSSIAAGDLDGDGKPDLVTPNFGSNSVSVFRNKIGDVTPLVFCPPAAYGDVFSNIFGFAYQWQVNTGNGFVNLSNTINYSGVNTTTLQLRNIPSAGYGNKYRCMVDGISSEIFEIRFADTWIGSVDSNWSNPGNWNCGSIPDSNTDVHINSGNIVINSNVTIRSLKLNPGATITVTTGNNLTILH